MSAFVPIALQVSIEVIKTIQCQFIQSDSLMYSIESEKYATCVCMTLHELLSKTKYVFSDKTGTLTSNIMEFKGCTIWGKLYEETINNQVKLNLNRAKANERAQFLGNNYQNLYNIPGQFAKTSNNAVDKILWNYDTEEIIQDIYAKGNNDLANPNFPPAPNSLISNYICDFWLCAAVCNEIVPTKENNLSPIVFQGPSPDEVTLVDAAKEVGFILLERSSNTLTLNILGKQMQIQILNKLEFSSERKCMSVIAKMPDQSIRLFIKGADDIMKKKLSPDEDPGLIGNTYIHLKKFALQVY